MKKYFHEYTEQELTTMSVEELNDIRNHVFSEDGIAEGVKAEMRAWKEFSNGVEEDHKKSINVSEMFHQMWTEESTIMYNVYSPEFLRHT